MQGLLSETSLPDSMNAQIPSIVTETFTKHSKHLRRLSLAIHEFKELAFKESRSSVILADFLEREGFRVIRGIAGDETAFVGTFSQGTGGPVEYDALPGIGHACGHNLIAVGSLGAALATKAWLEKDPSRKGTVKLFGTPGEESGGGKIHIINAGYYKDVDVSIMSHPAPLDGGFYPFLALYMFEVEFFGKNAHASLAPWEGINALDALLQSFSNINALRQAIHPDQRIHGIIQNGGTVPNIIPDYSKGVFMCRAMRAKDLNKLKENVRKCFEAAAISTRCTLKITDKMNYKDVIQNGPMALKYESYLQGLGIQFPPRATQEAYATASTDQGDVSYEVPQIHPVYKINTPEGVGNHTPGFAEASKTEEAFQKTVVSGKGLACVAIEFLRDGDFRNQVRKDFEARRKEMLS